MTQFAVADNCLQIGGRALSALADEMGRTPFYAYDSAVMSAQVQRLRELLPPELHLHYAMKANPMPAVVRHLAGITDGLDVASAGELEVALAAGADQLSVDSKQIHGRSRSRSLAGRHLTVRGGAADADADGQPNERCESVPSAHGRLRVVSSVLRKLRRAGEVRPTGRQRIGGRGKAVNSDSRMAQVVAQAASL